MAQADRLIGVGHSNADLAWKVVKDPKTLVTLAALVLGGGATAAYQAQNSREGSSTVGQTPDVPVTRPQDPAIAENQPQVVINPPSKEEPITAPRNRSEASLSLGDWHLAVNLWNSGRSGGLEQITVGSSLRNQSDKPLHSNTLDGKFDFKLETNGGAYKPAVITYYELDGIKLKNGEKEPTRVVEPGSSIFVKHYFELPGEMKNYSFAVVDTRTGEVIGRIQKGKVTL